nr:hypothetical protein [uncultured Oscillibacter sp.]
MKKAKTLIWLFVLLLLSACGGPVEWLNTGTSRGQEAEAANHFWGADSGRVDGSAVADYAAVLDNGEAFHGKTITVAGRVEASYDNYYGRGFVFRDRLGRYSGQSWDPEVEFEVVLADAEKFSELSEVAFSDGDYVLVRGEWYHYESNRYLKNAVVLANGEEAKAYADAFLEQWYARGRRYAEELPLTDYMNLQNGESSADGRIRIAGQVRDWKEDGAFYLENRMTGQKCVYVSLWGCPPEMKALLAEDAYVIVSGELNRGLRDCFVEAVGPEAEAVCAEQEQAWWQRYWETRDAYLADCAPYPYESAARSPREHAGERTAISGTVLRIKPVYSYDGSEEPYIEDMDIQMQWVCDDNTEYRIILDTGGGRTVYVRYYGELPGEPEFLAGDQATFYGACLGYKAGYPISLEEYTEDMPVVIAPYSSMNQ